MAETEVAYPVVQAGPYRQGSSGTEAAQSHQEGVAGMVDRQEEEMEDHQAGAWAFHPDLRDRREETEVGSHGHQEEESCLAGTLDHQGTVVAACHRAS